MALISLKSLGVSMSAPLFSNLDLTIGAGDRLGIVAANGRGKSTLLRCLTGELEPTSGDITRTRGLRVGHVEQSVPDRLLDRTFHRVVADALPPEQADSELWRVDVVLDSLDVAEAMRDRPMRALSGGWQRLALIAREREAYDTEFRRVAASDLFKPGNWEAARRERGLPVGPLDKPGAPLLDTWR